jgi:hypothetical protein
MPRVRAHWALLGRTLAALREQAPALAAALAAQRADFYAGGVAPDALRLFGGMDKRSSHFYDDQREETWGAVMQTIAQTHPAVADPAQLSPATRAWLAGYLAHILTDIAYWRTVLRRLPPFPEHAELHYGAWLLADALPLPPGDGNLDPGAVQYEAAPAWVDTRAVRELLDRVTGRLLVGEGMWAAELGYYRGRPELAGRSDEEILREHLPAWRAALAKAQPLLPPPVWEEFVASAVRGSVEAIAAYLAPRTMDGGPANPARRVRA